MSRKAILDFLKRFNPNVLNTGMFTAITVENMVAAWPNQNAPLSEIRDYFIARHDYIIPGIVLISLGTGLLPKKIHCGSKRCSKKEVETEYLQEVVTTGVHLPAVIAGAYYAAIGYYDPNANSSGNNYIWIIATGLAAPILLALKEKLNKGFGVSQLVALVVNAFTFGLSAWGVVGVTRRLQKECINLGGGFSDDSASYAFDYNSYKIGKDVGIGFAALNLSAVVYKLSKVQGHEQVHKLIKLLAAVEKIFLETPLSMMFSLGSLIQILATNKEFLANGVDPISIVWPFIFNLAFLMQSLYVASIEYQHEISHRQHHELAHEVNEDDIDDDVEHGEGGEYEAKEESPESQPNSPSINNSRQERTPSVARLASQFSVIIQPAPAASVQSHVVQPASSNQEAAPLLAGTPAPSYG